MRIYFAGSHSVGKSTLARYVSEKYKLPMITEIARAILSEKELNLDSLRTNLDVVDEYQSEIFYRQIEEEKKSKEFVSDRTFDCLAYAANHSRILSNLIKSKEFSEYIESIKKSDSFIFFVKPSKVTLKQDGVRETLNWDGIVRIDAMIKMLLEMYEIRHFQIDMESMQERVKIIDYIISLAKD